MAKLDTFTIAYINALLWSTTDESDPNTGGDPLDKNYEISDLSKVALAQCVKDCKKFQQVYQSYWVDDDQAGHDFAMTRNRHGTGFWDCDCYADEAKRVLTDAAHLMGEVHLYLSDPDADGYIQVCL